MTRQRILFLTPQPPDPARQGAAIRNWNLCVELAKRHEIDLLSFTAPDAPASDLGADRGAPWASVTTVPAPARSRARRFGVLARTRHADMADRLWSPRFLDALTALLDQRSYDVVQAEGIELGRYLLALRHNRDRGPLLAFDDHNAEHLLQRRAAKASSRHPRQWPLAAYSLVQAARLRGLERRLLRRCDVTFCVSPDDAAALRRLDPRTAPVVAPNGVDTEYFAPQAGPPDGPRIDLLFSGTLDYRPNVDAIAWFAKRVWPRLAAQRPGLHVALVGRSPAPAVRDIARQYGFLVTGAVADDRPYFAAATVYLLPMRFGGGVRLKLLNALAMGRAVVTTSAGREGTRVEDAVHVLVADDPASFAAAVEQLLDDAALRARLGAAGRDYVRARHHWPTIVNQIEAGYAQAALRRGSGGRQR